MINEVITVSSIILLVVNSFIYSSNYSSWFVCRSGKQFHLLSYKWLFIFKSR